jgi:hypothetical protein
MERSIVLAAAAAAIGAVSLAATAWRAVQIPAAQPSPFALGTDDAPPVRPDFRTLPVEAVNLIADNEPFREDRQPAPIPYRMPGDRQPERVEREAPPPPQPPAFQVLGTIMTADGGMAVIQTSDGLPPQFVNVDESVGGYRLVSVASTGATLSRGEQTFNLSVADPAVLREQPTANRNRNTNQRREQQEREEQARETLQQQTERMRQLMEQAGRSGAGGVMFGGVAPGTRVLVAPGAGPGAQDIVVEEQTVDAPGGQGRVRVITRGQRQAQ